MATPTRLFAFMALLTLFVVTDLSAQTNLTEENADCYGAVIITDSVFGPVFPGRGHGHILEIRDNPDNDPMYFEKEHHSIWYKFRAPWDCQMTFDIVPENPADDIDFMLWRGAIVDICQEIYKKEHKPVRSNIGRNDPAIGSRSGLSHEASEKYVRSGPSDHPYSSAVEAKKGEQFYLLVDQLTTPKGPYTIHFHFGPQPEEEVLANANKPKQRFVFKVVDSETGEPIKASLAVEGLELGEITDLEGASSYQVESKPFRSLKVSGVKRGYLVKDMKIKPSGDSLVTVEVPMIALRAGAKFEAENINFVGDKATILRASYKSVKQIEFFMKENPTVKIEIQGHVNGPNRRNSKALQDLSESRAKAVYDHLAKNGIKKERMTFVGYGNTQMIFPDPKYSHESEKNRRVEIKVLENTAFREDTAESLPPSDK